MRAYYTADRTGFSADSDSHILGELAKAHHFDLDPGQKAGWLKQILILREALSGIDDFTLYLEFAVPRMGKRVDTIILTGGQVFVIEFKVGKDHYDQADLDQVEDYALDLKNFHAGSHEISIIPILVPTLVHASRAVQLELALDQVAKPLQLSADDLGPVIGLIARSANTPLDAASWVRSGYRPTPTIIQAATQLYARHSVADITRSSAEGINLGRTQDIINRVIETCKTEGRRAVCFVTGVPGAGKTLAGLNIATQRSDSRTDQHATFLSGNGPLVDVLREALARDYQVRTKAKKSDADRNVKAFIQNIHHFRDEYLRSEAAPSDHIVIFDEAQRAWTQSKAASFMRQKRGLDQFDMSEPQFLLSVMDRHQDWCTVICLVGGGQEINVGEAGLSEWMAAIRNHFPHWLVHASAQIIQRDYDLTDEARAFITRDQVTLEDDLHLAVSMRSFRAETLSNFISHLLNGDATAARMAATKLDKYPLVMTRDLQQARQWLRDNARGSERYGLVASSGALRLRPEGLHVRAGIDPANWFLNGKDDVRSSFYMEEVASEFDVQGLELDWVGVCWDADLRYVFGWQGWNFKGTRWQAINDRFRRLYLTNAYRVLLTRARQGMVIFVPRGDDVDATRPSAYYDGTWAFLLACGVREL